MRISPGEADTWTAVTWHYMNFSMLHVDTPAQQLVVHQKVTFKRVRGGSTIDPSKARCRDVAHANNFKTKEMHALRKLKRLPSLILSPLNQP